ncbi:MAG: hypothetical protein QHC79_25855 [Pseudosphingobacterium sp.]|nr:hypothetical protein [Pseudosphingobacterium sp.]
MIKKLIIVAVILCPLSTRAQTIIFDRNHFNIVNENAGVRLGAENSHNNYLSTINNRIGDINLNVTAVVALQTMIYQSLSQVDHALRDGLTLRQIGILSADIISECSKIIQTASGDPRLLLFGEDLARQLRSRGLALVSDVSSFITKEGSDALMDFAKRDLLLKKVWLELQVMRSLAFGVHRAMYRAKINGIIRSANPFQGFINQDRMKAEEILRYYQLLQ